MIRQKVAVDTTIVFRALLFCVSAKMQIYHSNLLYFVTYRHTSFKRHLPRQMHVSSVDFGDTLQVSEQPTSIGRIKPELYKQKSVDSEDAKKDDTKTCGKINFTLKYDYENETLIVTILKAFDLPVKDFCGSSDPYVKIYLLPDRKRKFQTRVHRKTLNPTFDESFNFPVPYDELPSRKLHLSVFDFDRFSRHDMIGEVILENLFEASDLSRESSLWKDIQYATTVRCLLFLDGKSLFHISINLVCSNPIFMEICILAFVNNYFIMISTVQQERECAVYCYI